MPYLHSIGLENFRLFKERTTFELAPITILTGINNSGKSSLIKSLQLFKSSIKATGGLDELNFTGGRHNLGSFSQAINNKADENSLRFKFDFPLLGILETTFIELEYSIVKKDQESGILSGLRVFTEDNDSLIAADLDISKGDCWRIKIDLMYLLENFSRVFDKNYIERRDLVEREINDLEILSRFVEPEDYQDKDQRSIFDYFHFKHEDKGFYNYEYSEVSGFIKGFNKLKIELQEEIESRIKSFNDGGYEINYSSIFHDFDILTVINDSIDSIESILLLYDNDVELEYSGLGKYIFQDFLKKIFFDSLKNFSKVFSSINSMSSVRANSERLYSNNSSVVDINSLLIDFSKADFKNEPDIKSFISRSLSLFQIGEDIVINRHQGVATEIFIVKDGEKKLLADMGFGFTQLVPIIIKIALIAHRNQPIPIPWETYGSRLLILEEPESNLHPSYQSKLAELIIDAAESFNLQFIIETHSEYLIRNLQYLTATKKLKSGDTKIYYFHQPGTEDFEESPHRVIEIMKDGRLSKPFGNGFFDEADKIAYKLYKIHLNSN